MKNGKCGQEKLGCKVVYELRDWFWDSTLKIEVYPTRMGIKSAMSLR